MCRLQYFIDLTPAQKMNFGSSTKRKVGKQNPQRRIKQKKKKKKRSGRLEIPNILQTQLNVGSTRPSLKSKRRGCLEIEKVRYQDVTQYLPQHIFHVYII